MSSIEEADDTYPLSKCNADFSCHLFLPRSEKNRIPHLTTKELQSNPFQAMLLALRSLCLTWLFCETFPCPSVENPTGVREVK